MAPSLTHESCAGDKQGAQQEGRCPHSQGSQSPAPYLGSSHHSRCGRHIQAPLPEVHKGIITPVFCLDQAIIDFLSKEQDRHTELAGSNESVFSFPSAECCPWQVA